MITLKKDTNNIYRVYGLCNLQAGVIAKAVNTIDYSDTDNNVRFKEKLLIYKATGILPEHIVMLDQVHGSSIIEMNYRPQKNDPFVTQADGFVTMVHGLCLVIRTADCVPVILYDSAKGILAALHSGWRGCMQNITAEGIKKLYQKGSSPASVHVMILPSISRDAYEVGDDVASQFNGYILNKNGRCYLDMWNHIADTAMKNKIPCNNIYVTGICTFQNNTEFFSYRKGDKGRNLNFVYLS
ncbi:MAG TPA: polyphenol oxidase family protein [Spirochaetota bacterium]|nr:polyphenol oxidase family protein [Spirochaetota bacterium]HOR93140.1 polyphenol oxidase family protein [Spirochaetota bacterium]HOT20538.1 polyphenol oxidase family protein [Spirochaetota bacterium]HPD04945.1 polyphenol oxidase family protein [Spirochaetota bacterium]HQG42117.1 polyphenol oxidase family protein [Spirochaetota bacterium]